jgi:hypothetical protein
MRPLPEQQVHVGAGAAAGGGSDGAALTQTSINPVPVKINAVPRIDFDSCDEGSMFVGLGPPPGGPPARQHGTSSTANTAQLPRLQQKNRSNRSMFGSADGEARGGPASDRSGSDGPALLAWCLAGPMVLYYAMFFITHFVPVTATDSEGCKHKVRLRLTANFALPWNFLFIIDFLCLCPAHYWLTLYGGTSTVDWARNGNARGTVEAVATALGDLTRAEAVHFTGTLSPFFLGASVVDFQQENYATIHDHAADGVSGVCRRAALLRAAGPSTRRYCAVPRPRNGRVFVGCHEGQPHRGALHTGVGNALHPLVD